MGTSNQKGIKGEWDKKERGARTNMAAAPSKWRRNETISIAASTHHSEMTWEMDILQWRFCRGRREGEAGHNMAAVAYAPT